MQRHLHAFITFLLLGLFTQNAFANSLTVDPLRRFEAIAIQSSVVIAIYVFIILLQKRCYRTSSEEQKNIINRHKYWSIINFLLVGIAPIVLIIALIYITPRKEIIILPLTIYIVIAGVFGLIAVFAQIRRNIAIKYAIFRTLAGWILSIVCIHAIFFTLTSIELYRWHHVDFSKVYNI